MKLEPGHQTRLHALLIALLVVFLVTSISLGSSRKLHVNLHLAASPPPGPVGSHETSPEGEEFTAWFPVEPKVTVGKRFFGDRQKNYQFHFYTVFAGETLFLVESYEGDKPKELGRIAISGRRSVNGHASIELNGYKGVEFTQEIEGLAFKGRYFATKKHLYVVEVAKRGDYDPKMDQFLNSFTLESSGQSIPAAAVSNETNTAAPEKVYEQQQVRAKAIILSKLPATYTDSAREHQIRGTVVLQVELRATGQVGEIQVRSGLPGGLTEQSIEATKAIIFVPPMKDGAPVSTRVVVEYNFNIY